MIQNNAITEEQLEKALDYQKENPDTRIGIALVKLGFVDMKTIVENLAKQKPEVKQDVPALPEQGFKQVLAEQTGTKKKIGEILLEEKVINQAQLLRALEYQEQYPGTMFGQALINLGFVSKKAISEALRKMRSQG